MISIRSGGTITILSAVVSVLSLRFRSRASLELELVALRRQLIGVSKSVPFDALRKVLLAHPEVSPVEFKAALREPAAVETLPQLLPADAAARRAFIDTIREYHGDRRGQCRYSTPLA